MSKDEFSVYQFFLPDESQERVAYFVDRETAVRTAHRLTQSVGAQVGIVNRIIITDGGDDTVFEWTFGLGVTYPTRAELAACRQ